MIKKNCNCSIDSHRINEFIDGGFYKQIPLNYKKKYCGTYYVITTKDFNNILNINNVNNTGANIFEYLDNIITYHSNYHTYVDVKYINKDWHLKDNVKLIDLKVNSNNPIEFNKESIIEYMNYGVICASDILNSILFNFIIFFILIHIHPINFFFN